MKFKKHCKICGKLFVAYGYRNKNKKKIPQFCSMECYGRTRKKGTINVCLNCGKEFYVRPSWKNFKCCSEKCRYGWCRGERGANYKDGRTSKKHHCKEKDCNNKICYQTASYGSGRCHTCENKRRKGKNSPRYGKVSHGNGAYYKGAWMRSSWELLFAKWLDKQGIKWNHEPQAFPINYTYEKIKKEGTYRPDFYLPTLDLWIEIKGWWRDDAKVKFKAFKRIYPGIEIKVLGKKELKNDLLLQS